MEFIQAVITRMNSNSFLIKGWMITLVSALFALAAKDANVRYVLVAYIAIPAFWILDAFYLSQERQYRALYDEVRSKTEDQIDFSMDAFRYNIGRNRWIAALFSRTLVGIYPVVVAITLIIMFLIG
jgi:hypothetical protein